jgi:hypothetical protein
MDVGGFFVGNHVAVAVGVDVRDEVEEGLGVSVGLCVAEEVEEGAGELEADGVLVVDGLGVGVGVSVRVVVISG